MIFDYVIIFMNAGALGKVICGTVYIQDDTDACYEQSVLVKSLSGTIRPCVPLMQ